MCPSEKCVQLGVRDFSSTKTAFYRILLVDTKGGGFMYFGTTFMQLKCPADYKAPTVKKEPRGVPLPTITDRQSAIINGSAAKVRKNEVTVLLDKLTRLELENEAEELRNRYLQFFEYIPEEPSRYSVTESAGLLQSLTPWNMPIPKQEVNLVNDNRFCNRLKSAMEARDMTQTSLSKAAGISIGNISKYLAGTMQPRADKVKLLSEALNVESLWLMGEKESDNGAVGLSILYDKLDNGDQKRVYGLITALLKNEKYRV